MKKIVALLLAVIMVMSMLPTMAFADGEPAEPQTPVTVYVGEKPKESEDTYYYSLKEAMEGTESSPKIVKLMRDDLRIFDGSVSSYITIAEGKDITVDLNGHTAWYIETAGTSAVIENNGTLTIMDSKDVYAKGTFGKLVCGHKDSWTGEAVTNPVSSTLIVNNGTLNVQSGLLDSTATAIESTGIVTVTGGKVNAVDSAINMTKGTVTVEGGTVVGTTNGILMTYTENDNAEIVVKGGTVSGSKSLAHTEAIEDTATRKVTISGGQFTGDVEIGCDAVISDGIFEGNVTANDLTGFISGGTYKESNDPSTIDNEYCEISKNGRYEVVECYAQVGSYNGETWTASGRYPDVTTALAVDGAQTVKLTRSTNESVTLPEDVTFIVPNELTYSGKVSAPAGFIVKVDYEANGTHYSLRTEKQEITNGIDPDEEEYEAACALLNGSNNNVQVNINKALKDSSSAKNKDQKLNITLKAVTLSESIITSANFDVKPQYNSSEGWTLIANDQIEGEITFRLPVSSDTEAKVAAVYHEETLMDFYPIQGSGETGKYIELSAKEFSAYKYEVLDGVSADDKLVIKHANGSFTGYSQLLTTGEDDSAVLGAVSEWGDGDLELILMKDYTIGEGENFDEKIITLNLNGHDLSGEAVKAQKVTVKNSDAENKTTLKAIGIYANNVSEFAADGYDTKTSESAGEGVTNNELFRSNNDIYTVVVDAQPTGSTADRDTTTGDHTWTVDGKDGTYNTEGDALEAAGGDATKVHKNAWLDIFAGDKIKVTVKVEGARFAAANVTLTFNPDNFKVTAPKTGWTAVKEDGQTIGYRFYDYYQGNDKYYENGEVLGTFTFTAKDSNSAKLNEAFKVSDYKTYVAKAWSDGWSSGAANALNKSQLKDDYVNIILKQMSVTVTAENNLSFKDTDQALLKTAYTVKDNLSNSPITDTTIKYAVMTKTEVEGTAFVDEDGNGKDDVYTEKGESETDPGYVEGMEPKVPTDNDYGATMTAKNAGDYVVFWKVSKDGYDTVSGRENVSIAPLDVTLTWTMPKDKNSNPEQSETISLITGKTTLGDGTSVNRNLTPEDVVSGVVRADYLGRYSTFGFYFEEAEDGMKASTSVYNNIVFATITMTGKPDTAGTNELKAVGTYTFKAELDPNYNILNPEITVIIDGNDIKGYELKAKEPVVFDNNPHQAVELVEDDNRTPDVTIEYLYSKDGGETWIPWTSGGLPTFTDSNSVPYKVKVKLSKDGFYTKELTANFSIKPVVYFTEKSDYVTGWDLVLCYTNEEVPSFNYDGEQMFDVTDFGYKLGSAWSDEKTQTVEGTEYTHVYGIVVEGNADVNLVLPSNTLLYTGDNKDGHVEHKIELTGNALRDANNNDIRRMDVNMSGSIDINDLVAVAATYNVDNSYLKSTDESIIAIVLRADVNGNKIVNTYDCSLIMTNTTIEEN